MSLPRLSIGRPIAVAMLFLAIALLGAISFGRLPVDLLPDVAYPRLVVYTTYSGAAPQEIERMLSEQVEQAIGTVPGVQKVESVSREGVSLVSARFAWGTDMDFAALGAREKLDALRDRLPERASRPAVLRLDPRSEAILSLSVSADGADLQHLRELSDAVFRRRLEQVDGVARAVVTGGEEREIHVEVDAERLASTGVTLDDVVTALERSNASAPGGTLLRGRYRYSLRTLGELPGADAIREVPLLGGAGAPAGLRVGDVATVSDGVREREAIARHDQREAVGLLVFKNADANTVRVTERVEEVLAQLAEQYPEVRLDVAASQAAFVREAIDNVVKNLLQGAALAFLVLLLFLRDVRYPVAIALAIPLSVIAAFGLMDAFGVSLNLMSLGGLALGVGMLVDNAIVVLENIFRHREQGLGAHEAAVAGAEEVQGAITASTLTTIAVFGPILYLEGVAGELFGALSLAVAFSLLASLFVALTLLPTLAARWGGKTAPDSQYPVLSENAAPDSGPGANLPTGASLITRHPPSASRYFDRIADRYERVLEWALAHKAPVVGGAVAVLGLTVLLGLMLERRVLPLTDDGVFRAKVELPRGTPLEETAALAARLERAFLQDAEVRTVFTHVGRRPAAAGVEEDESGLHTATLEVRLADGSATAAAVARFRPQLDALPPGVVTIETGGATAIGRLLGAGEADVAVRLRGDDLGGAMRAAEQVAARLAGVGALTNVRVGTELGQPEIRVEVERERAESYGIEPGRVVRTVQTYMHGRVATELVEFDRRIPIVVRLPEAERRSLSTLERLELDGVPLRQLLRTETTLAPSEIQRADQARVVTVYADVRGGGIDRAVAEAEAALAGVELPRGLRMEIGGENEEMRKSFRELAFAFALALLLVYGILAAKFESFVHPLIVLGSVPLGLVGAIIALWITGAGLNTLSLIGLVVLAGIVDNDAVVKISFINQLRARGLPLRQAVLQAGRARLRPILMTTMTTMFGVLPMALLGGRGAELRTPLAVSIFGGLLSATVLTLIVLPAVYELVEEWRERRGWGGRVTQDRIPVPAVAEAGEFTTVGR
jgi:hydrophobic/amphiphilic exporter-1 (mainly G- bacteria), HAE1 family